MIYSSSYSALLYFVTETYVREFDSCSLYNMGVEFNNTSYSWYQKLLKPPWAPPSYLFGPVWTMLYILIFISFGYIFWLIWKKKLPISFGLPFFLNLVFNFIFTPLQFGLKNNVLALLDILAVLITLIVVMHQSYSRKSLRWVAYTQIPYLLWVSFATALQLSITYLNF